jgi:hypothetical protein
MRRAARNVSLGACVVIGLVLWAWHRRSVSHGAHDAIVAARSESNAAARGAPEAPVNSVVETSAVATNDAVGEPAAPGNVVATAAWGSGEQQVGRRLGSDGTPESPSSIAIDSQGNLLVLDQMNQRVLRFGRNGAPTVVARLDRATDRDLAVARDGSLALFDGTADASVVRVVGPDGRTRGELPLRGANLGPDENATGVFVDGDNVYVERDHGPLVRVGSTSGSADGERTEIPGRPSRDGRLYVSAGITDPDAGRFWVNAVDRATQEHRFTLELRATLTLQSVELLDTDLAGTLYVAVLGLTPEVGDHDSSESIALYCLDPASGHVVGQNVLPSSNLQEVVQRQLAVLDGGGVLLTVRTDAGFSVQQFNCQ